MSLSIPAPYRNVVTLAALIAIVCAGYSIYRQSRPKNVSQTAEWMERMYELGGRVLADRIGAGKKALVLVPAHAEVRRWMGVEGTIRGLQAAGVTVAGQGEVAVADDMDPLANRFPPATYEELLQRHPGVDVVISLAGIPNVPSPLGNLDVGRWPPFYLAALTGVVTDLRRLHSQGLLAGVVQPRTDPNPPRPPFAELRKMPDREAFDMLFELSTNAPAPFE